MLQKYKVYSDSKSQIVINCQTFQLRAATTHANGFIRQLVRLPPPSTPGRQTNPDSPKANVASGCLTKLGGLGRAACRRGRQPDLAPAAHRCLQTRVQPALPAADSGSGRRHSQHSRQEPPAEPLLRVPPQPAHVPAEPSTNGVECDRHPAHPGLQRNKRARA